MGKVIVIGCNVGGLAVIRSLGRRGIDVIALSHNPADFAHTSKYVTEYAECPHPSDEGAFIDFLLDRADRWGGALILETGDYHAVALAKHKPELVAHYRLVTPDWDMLRRFIEKQHTYALADECGVPHPRTLTPTSRADLDATRDNGLFPCILKPIRSHEFVRLFKTKSFTIRDFDMLVEKFALCQEADQPVMIQEIIPGSDANLERVQTYVNSDGNFSALFFNNKVRQNPPQFGVMRVGVSTPRNPDVEELTCRLLTHMGYRGYCSVEFKRDPRDGLLKLIEINARMPRSGWLAIASGVDFPWLIYQDLVHRNPVIVDSYIEHSYMIELYADVLNALWRDNRRAIGLRGYLRPYLARHRVFAVLSWRDPKPFLAQTRVLPAIMRRQTRRV